MTISLNEPRIKKTLERLYEESTKSDDAVRPRAFALMESSAKASGKIPTDSDLAPLFRGAYMAVAPEIGRLIYQLVRARQPKLVIEFGTSYGLSTLHIAAALRDNGAGRVITTELEPDKVSGARANFAAAGLEDLIELREGDALETLRDVSGIDLLLLDGWKKLYLPLLRQLEPKLSPGCPVLADDINIVPEWMAEYVAYIRDPANGYVTVTIPIDDGMEISMR